jgi:YHS domain-containing protein
MFRLSPRLAALVSAAALLTAVVPALAADAKAVDEPTAAAITRVEPNKVCMVNNQFMDKDQIPVEVEGKTYYGCCNMCKERLTQDAASRSAVDPLSGKTVDKAKAVIGAQVDGSVLYFENEENLASYAANHKSGT